jgi:hypothetical protein
MLRVAPKELESDEEAEVDAYLNAPMGVKINKLPQQSTRTQPKETEIKSSTVLREEEDDEEGAKPIFKRELAITELM